MSIYTFTAPLAPRAGYLGPPQASTFGKRREPDPYIAAQSTHQDCPELAVEGPLSDALVWKLCTELDYEAFEGGFGMEWLTIAMAHWLGFALKRRHGRDRWEFAGALLGEWVGERT